MAAAGINSNLQFALPQLPMGTDPQMALLLNPLYTAVFSLFSQVSSQLGQTVIDPSLYSTVAPSTLSKMNGLRKLYLQNTTGVTILAGKFVYITNTGTIALSGIGSATAPIGFVTGDVLNNAWGEIVMSVGILAGTGLTPGAKYQAGAAGTLAAFAAGPAIAIALSTTIIYVNIPIY